MFQPPIVAIFREVFFEGRMAQNIKTIYKYKIFIQLFVLNCLTAYTQHMNVQLHK